MRFYRDITLTRIDWNLPIEIPINRSRKLFERHFYNIEDICPMDIINKLDSVGLRPALIRLFAWPANHFGIWHIDGKPLDGKGSRNVSMNWVLVGSGKIQWNSNMRERLLPSTGVYLGCASTSGDLVEEETLGNGVLVDTSSPHRVITGPDARTSITFQWTTSVNDFPFTVMVEKLMSIGLIV